MFIMFENLMCHYLHKDVISFEQLVPDAVFAYCNYSVIRLGLSPELQAKGSIKDNFQ